MPAATDFGLYPTRGRVAGQRVAAGQVFTLGTPVQDGGVTRFRQSLWLAVPAAARDAEELRLAASALQLRFEPLDLEVGTDDGPWFPVVTTGADNKTVRIEFSWPATVVRLADPSPVQRGLGFDLYRADGAQRADAPTVGGRTGVALSPPWVGTPMVVVMQQAVLPRAKRDEVMLIVADAEAGPSRAAPMLAMGGAATASGPRQDKLQASAQALRRQRSHVVPALTLRGLPTSPRATLRMEARGDQPETLLWQALLPGEQGTVTLPQQPVADEWAAALEQVRKRLAAEDPPLEAPQLLRLDIESDAPARVTLLQATLALDAEFNSLAAALRADFDGSQPQTRALPLDLPAGAVLQGLRLVGRISGGTDAAVAALPTGGRRGLLLSAADRVLLPTALASPTRPGGLALAWWPLSEAVRFELRLLPDAGGAPGTVALAEWTLAADTPAAAWLALRGAAPDLQPQRLWLALSLVEGSGLWLADVSAPAPLSGFSERHGGASVQRLALGLQPAFAWLAAAAQGAESQPRQVALLAGETPIADALAERFELDCPPALLASVAAQGLQVRCGSAAQLTLVSARARLRLA